MKHHRSAAQALIWLAMSLPLFVAIAGLAIDGGLLLASRRHLQSVADGAARAAATRLDLERLRSSAGADVQLDSRGASDAAWAYLQDGLTHEGAAAWAPRARVEVAARRVNVLIEGSLPTAFLRVVHIDSVPVLASAQADVEYGIRDGGGG
jgi:uncharacterized membrane protein